MTIEGERNPIPVPESLEAAALRDHPLFSGIDEREIECLLGSAETRRFDAGELLFRRGDPGDSVLLVLSGRVSVETRLANGETVVMNVLEAGELVGEMAVLEGTTRSADITALEPCEALIIPNGEFLGLLVGHPGLAVRMLGTLTERLRSLSERLGAAR
jgi:CRP/FNR family cyclic AMP-dependent transcriptional regulator